jgi:competence protein ComEA
VAAAVEAAGGLAAEAEPATVNLAAVVTDGQQIVVGAPGVAGPDSTGAAGPRVDGRTSTPPPLRNSTPCPASGRCSAQRIVDHRKQGPFTSVDQLDDVPGIGPTRAAELAELVTV